MKRGSRLSDEQVMERLLRETAPEREANYKVGTEAGIAWARDIAPAVSLRRLEQFRNRIAANEWEDFFLRMCHGESVAHVDLVETVSPDAEWREFWEEIVDKEEEGILTSPSFVRGFAEGALSAWKHILTGQAEVPA